MFTIEGDKLTIYATDLNTNFSSTTKLKTTSKEKKSFVTDPKKLAEFLALLAPGDIVLIVEEKKLPYRKKKTKDFLT